MRAFQRAAMVFDDRPGNGQAEAGATTLARTGFVDPIQAFGQSRQLMLADARGGVLPVQASEAVMSGQCDVQAARGIGIAQRVLQEVAENLVQADSVATNRWNRSEFE